MKYFWIVLNSTAVALSLLGGYKSMAPERLRHTNPDAFACLAVLIGMPVFAILSVGYSIDRWEKSPLQRPSWNRNPFNWWGDPLQSLFISTLIMAATALGSALKRPTFGSIGFWTMGVYICFVVGLLLGQIFAYRIFRKHIAVT